jgi:hypothetical protein
VRVTVGRSESVATLILGEVDGIGAAPWKIDTEGKGDGLITKYDGRVHLESSDEDNVQNEGWWASV